MWLSNRAGVLKVETPQGTGIIHIKDGMITHATAKAKSGLEAVDHILRWGGGKFQLDSTDAVTETVRLPLQGVILEATRQIDEWQEISKVIPSLDCILKISEPLPPELDVINLKDEAWKLLSQIDGKRSIHDIASRLGYSEFETARVAFGLARAKLIMVWSKILSTKSGGIFKRFRSR
jgi:hypothetical protein